MNLLKQNSSRYTIFILCILLSLKAATSNLPDVGNLPLPPVLQLKYFEIDESVAQRTVIQQAIIPQLEFTSSGTITSFSALTVLVAVDSFLRFLPHLISFTIMRPRGLGLYDVVGHNVLKFSGSAVRRALIDIDNSSGLVPENFAFFNFTDEVPVAFMIDGEETVVSNGPISFQAGDILGWTQFGNPLHRPLSLVYVESNTTDAVNGFSTPPSEQVLCSVSECDVRTDSLNSIIPYFSVKYSKQKSMTIELAQ